KAGAADRAIVPSAARVARKLRSSSRFRVLSAARRKDTLDVFSYRVPVMRYPCVRNYIAGGCRDFAGEHRDVISPLAGDLLTQVPLSGAAEVAEAVAAARDAFPAWAARPIQDRSQVFFRYRALLEQHLEE